MNKPVFRKWWFWVIIVVLFLAIGIIGSINNAGVGSHISAGNQQALKEANAYLDLSDHGFSYTRLVDSLEHTGFTTEQAIFAADNCNADWNEQARKDALYLLESFDFGFSYTGLLEELDSDGFTAEQASYAVDHCNADWNKQALKEAVYNLNSEFGNQYSYTGLIGALEHDGFTAEQATYAADNCGTDWNEQALRAVLSLPDLSSYSQAGLIEHLEWTGFTVEQATYAADNCGIDWNGPALQKAMYYLKEASSYPNIFYSYAGLVEELESDGFTTEQATYAADNCGADWNEQAASAAWFYASFGPSKEDLIQSLVEQEGFTPEQAAHGAKENGYK